MYSTAPHCAVLLCCAGRHMSYLGHAILGDGRYGGRDGVGRVEAAMKQLTASFMLHELATYCTMYEEYFMIPIPLL